MRNRYGALCPSRKVPVASFLVQLSNLKGVVWLGRKAPGGLPKHWVCGQLFVKGRKLRKPAFSLLCRVVADQKTAHAQIDHRHVVFGQRIPAQSRLIIRISTAGSTPRFDTARSAQAKATRCRGSSVNPPLRKISADDRTANSPAKISNTPFDTHCRRRIRKADLQSEL